MLKNIRFQVNLTKSHEIVFTVSRGLSHWDLNVLKYLTVNFIYSIKIKKVKEIQ